MQIVGKRAALVATWFTLGGVALAPSAFAGNLRLTAWGTDNASSLPSAATLAQCVELEEAIGAGRAGLGRSAGASMRLNNQRGGEQRVGMAAGWMLSWSREASCMSGALDNLAASQPPRPADEAGLPPLRQLIAPPPPPPPAPAPAATPAPAPPRPATPPAPPQGTSAALSVAVAATAPAAEPSPNPPATPVVGQAGSNAPPPAPAPLPAPPPGPGRVDAHVLGLISAASEVPGASPAGGTAGSREGGTVPEPASLWLAMLGLAAALRRSRRGR